MITNHDHKAPTDYHETSSEEKKLRISDDFPVPTLNEWREVVEKDLKGADYEKKLLWKTPEGFTVKPLYTQEDLKNIEHLENLPGYYPYTRGTNPLQNVNPGWQIRQDTMSASPEDVNQAIRDGLARGENAIGIRLDNAARIGLDGDHPDAKDLCGRGGCTLTSVNGLRIALQDIDLDRYPITIRCGTSAVPVLSMLVALAEERGINRRVLFGAIECDPIRELVKYGSLRAPLSLMYREMADMVSFCQSNTPGIRSIMVNSQHWHNGGASTVQELGYTLSTGIEYLREMVNRGLSVDQAALATVFSFSVSTNLFMEVAKIRAARMLWAKIVKSFGSQSEDAQKMFIHARTSTFTKTKYDPYNNMLRSAVESFAAGVAGVDSMYVAPFDETLGRPDTFSSRIARNQQIILKEEAYLSRIVDPGAGSYYIESLTDSVAREAWSIIQETDAHGGMIACLKQGLPQQSVAATYSQRQKGLSTRRTPVVGITNYADANEKEVSKGHIPREEFVSKRKNRVNRLKAVRSNSLVRNLLTALTQTVYAENGNLMEPAINAIKEGATLAEVLDALLQGADGEHVKVERILSRRLSMPYEKLRDQARAFKARTGSPPEVLLLPTGPLTMRRARADFSFGFFNAGGFSVNESEPFEKVDELKKTIKESKALVYVACSDDPSYEGFVPELVKTIKAAKPEALVYVAGYPAEQIDRLNDAGVDGFIHIKSDALETLGHIHKKLSISD